MAGVVEAADPGVAALRRPSGRPWLIGRWEPGELVHAVAGPCRVALLGCAAVSRDRLADQLARARDLAGLDRLALETPGSFHLVAEIDGHQRVQGTASGLRRVFHAMLGGDGGIIAGDRADVVAALAGLERLDLTALVLCLVDPVAPHPLDDRPLWLGLTAVPPDHWLCVTRRGTPRNGATAGTHRRWWRPPEPTSTSPRGRRRCGSAGDRRGGAHGRRRTVTADLSGGLDSTPLRFLAAAGPATVVPYTGMGRDPADDDARSGGDRQSRAGHRCLRGAGARTAPARVRGDRQRRGRRWTARSWE